MSTRGNQSNRGDGRGGRGSSRGRGLDRGGGQRGDGRGRGRGGSRGRGQDSGRGSPGASSPQRGSRGSYRARGDRGSYVARGTAGAHSAHIPVAHGAHVPSTSGQPPVATIGPRAPDEEAYQDLINRLRPLSLSDGPKHPPRPGIGKAGTKTLVQANFFPIKLPVGPFYEYTVTMEPNPKRGWERKQIFKLFMESQEMEAFRPHIAHDNSQRLISAKLLPENLEPVFIPFHEDGEEPNVDSTTHTVQLTLKETLDLDKLKQYIAGNPEARDPDAIQPLIGALDLVAQQHAGQEGYRVGKNKYFIPSKAERFELSPGIDAFQGFYLSVRPAYKDLMLNVNVATAAFFRPGNLADALLTFGLRTGGANLTLPEGFSEKIKMTVKTLHNGFRRKIKQIGTTSARRTTFPKGGRTVTVEQYFKEEYPDIRLNHPDDRPVIDVSGPSSPNPVWIPSELCEILPGQPLFDLTEQHLRLMIKNISQKSPSANRTAILNNGFPSLGLVPRRPPLDGDGFGIEVGGEMITVEARQLRPPNVTYSPQKLARITDASWNFMNEKFHKGVVVRSWWVVVIKDGGRASTGTQDPKIQNLVRDFVKKCRDSGMSIPLAQGQGRGQGQGQGRGRGEPRYMDIQLPRHEKWKKDRREAVEKIRNVFEGEVDTNGKPEFALVLLENQDSFIYPAIKRIGDVELGLTTVHILLDKLFRNNRPDQYYANVALKVNTKLGGINHKLDPPAMAWLKKKPTMMVGIDVTHPGIKAKWGSPSIAAVVANLDDEFVQFPGSIGIQKGREEMVQNLKGMMIERLDLYKKKNKRLPERVFVFRDGVSEGQFKIVNRDELPQILEAFSAFSTAGQGGAYRPKLSIVVCGKRHHARAYPINPNDQQQATRNGNTKPGTVIDTGITAVFDFDFYLQAHAGIQGHAKPTHYTIIYDENTFSADEIQQGTHNASYLYARASKAVSLVPPAYYADLACERGRCYLNDFLSFEDPEKNKGIGKGKGKDKDKKREEERKRVYGMAEKAWGEGLHDDMKDTMFYI